MPSHCHAHDRELDCLAPRDPDHDDEIEEWEVERIEACRTTRTKERGQCPLSTMPTSLPGSAHI